MVAQGNSSDAPPCAILSRPRSWCLMISCGAQLTCLPYHSLYDSGSNGYVAPPTLLGCESLVSVIKYVHSTWLMVPLLLSVSSSRGQHWKQTRMLFLQVVITQHCFHFKPKSPGDDCKPMPVFQLGIDQLSGLIFSIFPFINYIN